MVESSLTKEMIDTGAILVRKLDERGLPPDAAFWLYFPDEAQWRLVISEVDVGDIGPKKIYRKIQKILAESTDEITAISLDDVALAKPDTALIALLKLAMKTGPGIAGVRLKNNVINGTLIEDSYIYRLN
jgi:hypothetical protein